MKIAKTGIVIAAIAVAMAMAPAFAAEDSEGSNVTVNVSELTRINMAPENLQYTADNGNAVAPGAINDQSDSGYSGLEVENTGSENVTEIYFNTSHPGPEGGDFEVGSSGDRPFGQGVPGNYDAGNFIQINPQDELPNSKVQSGTGYQYVSRLEFNVSNDLSYVQVDSTGSSERRYGRHRFANESFFWMIDDASIGGVDQNGCNGGSSSTLYWGNDPQSTTQTGTVDFNDGTEGYNNDYESADIGTLTDSNYGVVDEVRFQTYEGDRNYTAFTWCGRSADGDDNSTHVFFSRYNIFDPEEDGDVVDTSGQRDLGRVIDATGGTDSNELKPGEYFTIQTRVAVPTGVAEGTAEVGDLTVVAQSDGSS